jgi:hypothetical protein
MPKYLVKFLNTEYYPDFKNLKSYKINLGSFLYYREIEDHKRRDVNEGQRGLDLILKRPCSKLAEYIKQSGYGYDPYTHEYLDNNGNFIPEYHFTVHDHMYDYNAWVFCCSMIDDLNEIPILMEKFECDSYYFISDIDKFINSIQHSLAQDIILNPKTLSGELRIKHPQKGNVFLDGWKDLIQYSNELKSMSFTYETLTNFLVHKDSKSINQKYWFMKSEQFSSEKEFRFILFPSKDTPTSERYSINEKSCLLDVNFTHSISQDPIDISSE